MKTNIIDTLQDLLEKKKHKGPVALLIYLIIFLFLGVNVMAKFLGNIFTINKAKLK
jgi:hypothetical protein